MKVRINTIGKKIHTLVKENTPRPCCHKIWQECGFTQKTSFFSVLLCFLPHCHANIGRQVRLIPPNTYQEIYDTHTCNHRMRKKLHVTTCNFLADASPSKWAQLFGLTRVHRIHDIPHIRTGTRSKIFAGIWNLNYFFFCLVNLKQADFKAPRIQM